MFDRIHGNEPKHYFGQVFEFSRFISNHSTNLLEINTSAAEKLKNVKPTPYFLFFMQQKYFGGHRTVLVTKNQGNINLEIS